MWFESGGQSLHCFKVLLFRLCMDVKEICTRPTGTSEYLRTDLRSAGSGSPSRDCKYGGTEDNYNRFISLLFRFEFFRSLSLSRFEVWSLNIGPLEEGKNWDTPNSETNLHYP